MSINQENAYESLGKESMEILSTITATTDGGQLTGIKSDRRPSQPVSVSNYQYTLDLIHLYNNLNNKYRMEAFDSLDLAHQAPPPGTASPQQNVFEFKLKLLFSVVVVIKHFLFYLTFAN